MRVVVLTVGLVAMMSLITGCSGSKCESVCSDANACEITERSTDVDCPEFCKAVEDFNARAVSAGQKSCDTEFQAHLQCWEQNSAQICSKEFEGCEESGEAWTACMSLYCNAIGEDPKGTDPNCFIDRDVDEEGNPIFEAFPALYPYTPGQ